MEEAKKVCFQYQKVGEDTWEYMLLTLLETEISMFCSQLLSAENRYVKATANGIVPDAPGSKRDGDNKAKDNFAYFKTRSGKLEHQLSRLLSKPQEKDDEALDPKEPEIESLPARRFFDALKGPELEILRVS